MVEAPRLRVDVVTIFPEAFAPLQVSVLGRAQRAGILQVRVWNLRDFTTDRHRTTDDYPYGGGPGMVMKAEPFFAAARAIAREAGGLGRVLLTSPQGKPFTQRMAQELSRSGHLVVLCGHYEGVDERVLNLVTREVSLGDFVLTCGEIPALALLNGVIRLLPGTVGKVESLKLESFEDGLLDYPQYTRPAEFRGWRVPEVLLSGNHQAIARWRHEQQIERTQKRRPDLWQAWQERQKLESPEAKNPARD